MAPELMTKKVVTYGTEVDTYRFEIKKQSIARKKNHLLYIQHISSFGLTMWVIVSEAHRDPFAELDVCYHVIDLSSITCVRLSY